MNKTHALWFDKLTTLSRSEVEGLDMRFIPNSAVGSSPPRKRGSSSRRGLDSRFRGTKKCEDSEGESMSTAESGFIHPDLRRGPVCKYWILAFGMTIFLFQAAITDLFAIDLAPHQKSANAGLPGEWLNLFGSNAREAGLANASVALGGSGSAYANPAGLAEGKLGEANLMIAPLFSGGQYHALSLSHPLALKRYLGITILSLSSGEAEQTDALGQTRGSFRSQDIAFLLSFGERVTSSLNFGFSIKAVKQSIADYSASSFGLDLGLQTATEEGFGFGVALSNILPPSLKLKDQEDTYPLVLRAGPSYRTNNMTLSADFTRLSPTKEKVMKHAFGIELRPFSGKLPFFIRAGRNQRETAFGFGIGNGPLSFDYAVAFHELDINHRFGVSFRYGYISPAAQARLDTEWQKLRNREAELKLAFREGIGKLKEESQLVSGIDFEEGLTHFRQALAAGDLDMSRRLLEKLRAMKPEDFRLQALQEEIGKRELEKQIKIAKKDAQVYYGSGLYEKALRAAKKALQLGVQDSQIQIIALMSQARIFIVQDNYHGAQEQLERVVEIDPDFEEVVSLYRKVKNVVEIEQPKGEGQ